MAGTRVRRQVQVLPSDDGNVRLPVDIADLLGDEVEIQVGPGRVVTLQPSTTPATPLTQTTVRAPQPGGTAVLEVRNLSVMYGTFKAVDDVSFQVARGEILASWALTAPARPAPSAPSRACSNRGADQSHWTALTSSATPLRPKRVWGSSCRPPVSSPS